MAKSTCGLFIIDSEGKILICEPYGGIKTSHGYTVPKGKIEKGETTLEAAIRETEEECGLSFRNVPEELFVDMGSLLYPHKKKRLHGFAIHINNPVNTDGLECKSFTDKGHPEIVDFKVVSLKKAVKCLHHVQGKLLKSYLDTINM